MKKILNNRLMLGLFGGLGFYWGIAPVVPTPLLGNIVAVALLIFGGFVLSQHYKTFLRVVFLQERDPEWPGSHYSIVGPTLVSTGLVFGGALRYYVNNFSDWDLWIGTASSNFSSVLIAAGMAFTFAGPQTDDRGFRVEGSLRFLLAIVVAFSIGCVLTSWALSGEKGVAYIMSDRAPLCPKDRPFWGSSRMVFHGPDSPYRALLTPSICFQTEQEAIDSGYRRWKG